MTYRGKIINGTVVLDEKVNLPDGMLVTVDIERIDADFWRNPSLEEIIQRQGVKPCVDPDELGIDWPDGEPVERVSRDHSAEPRLMESVLLDTDVFSFFFRRDVRCLSYRDDIRDKRLCLSFATAGELRFGAIARGWGERRRQELEDAIAGAAILSADDALIHLWAQVKAVREQAGRPISSEDCWIAATALRHDLPLLTHNAADFQDIPRLKLITHADAGQ